MDLHSLHLWLFRDQVYLVLNLSNTRLSLWGKTGVFRPSLPEMFRWKSKYFGTHDVCAVTDGLAHVGAGVQHPRPGAGRRAEESSETCLCLAGQPGFPYMSDPCFIPCPVICVVDSCLFLKAWLRCLCLRRQDHLVLRTD